MFIRNYAYPIGVLVALGVFLIGGYVTNANAFTIEAAATYSAPYTVDEVLADINAERINAGLPALVANEQLTLAAQNRANDMVMRQYFSHTTPEQKPFWDTISATGYSYLAAGENLAIFYSSSEDMVSAWMHSPTHRANIMSQSYEETGIGLAYGRHGGFTGWFVVQLFGTPTK